MKETTVHRSTLAWHFVQADGTIRGLGMKAAAGLEIEHAGRLEPCSSGLHASLRVADALKYSASFLLSRVRCSGELVHHNGDKFVCRKRKILQLVDVRAEILTWAATLAGRALDRVGKLIPGFTFDPAHRAAGRRRASACVGHDLLRLYGAVAVLTLRGDLRVPRAGEGAPKSTHARGVTASEPATTARM